MSLNGFHSLATGNGTLQGGLFIKHMPSYYSTSQVARYLYRIGFFPAEDATEAAIAAGKFPITVENIERIVRLHMCTFPFENIPMHYTSKHMVDVDPQKVFTRLLDEGKGSYCFGQNTVLLGILRGLGYRAYNAAARVNLEQTTTPKEFTSLTHLVVLVQPFADSNITYLADVGFGPGVTRPVLLSDAKDNIVTGISASERFRLTKREDLRSSLACNGVAKQDWTLEVQHLKGNDSDPATSPWTPHYMFFEQEFYSPDILDGSFTIWARPSGIFWSNVVAVMHFLLDEENKMIFHPSREEKSKRDIIQRDLGRVVLWGSQLKYIIGPHSEAKELKTELERVEVLRDIFGIMVKDEDIQFIQGRQAALGT
ncbi:hypothetical protein AMATHDRAFT_4662 [Amanita thiersii Skay4041]|uniref:Uncharacterized protein n=1 Tax=Amanita thiersii Skay4041 TaxID=703135 RepID=A0A2A9NI33_9AGAR|nr:hypothetical protein AMATHDRAFT_4662 [Amanita thiersii Skay4041]